jgi:hypothetical protein
MVCPRLLQCYRDYLIMKPARKPSLLIVLFLSIINVNTKAQQDGKRVNVIPVQLGWARNSVNTVIFRKNSLATFRDTQYIGFYDAERYVVLGKRKLGGNKWQLKRTAYQGNTNDAHNTISLMVDADGFLHLSWDHHNNELRYCRSIAPGSLEMSGKQPMTGKAESKVSYPEFYTMPNGDLLFFYRNGASGQGNLVINKYSTLKKQWQQLHTNLIDGEGERNAYWQACVDQKGTIHLSWVWRETPDVASNHDLGYACSKDGGITWQKSNGDKYKLPITAATAEYAARIPPKSELINQTSMTTDEGGNPFIATYWREQNNTIPQYHVVYRDGKQWQSKSVGFHKTAFSLSGAGSKRIPISRPQVLVKGQGKNAGVIIVFRDEERGNKVSVAETGNVETGKWKVEDLNSSSVGSWEPTYDTELWKRRKLLDLFVQHVEQADAEGLTDTPPQMVQVLEWKPMF